jgi:C4-dicarboxylate-specific signal transduction histidine kinase
MASTLREVRSDGSGGGSAGPFVEADGVLWAVRALSELNERDALLRKLLQLMLQHGGASRAVLIGMEAGQPVVQASALMQHGRMQVHLLHAAPSEHGVPPDLLAQAIARGGPAGRGAALCLPMDMSGPGGLLYLENAAAPLPFTPRQLHWLTALAAQAAVSLATARRLAALQEENTALRRIELALRESQAMLVLGEQISRSGSWSWHPGQRRLQCTAQFCRMFGLGDCGGQVAFADFLARVHPDDRERVRQHSTDAVAQGLPFLLEYRAFDAAGGLRFISAAGKPLAPPWNQHPAAGVAGAGGARFIRPGFVGTAVDITERRAFEDDLHQAQAELARVARLTTVGQLTASIAHEVNQPLMSIASNAGAALRWLDRQPPDLAEVRASLQDIAGQSERAGAIIAGLQALTRKAPARLGPVDLHDTVRAILAISRVELERHQIALELALMAAPSVVTGDTVQLQQLLLNLVINAVEALALAPVTGRARLLAICSWTTQDGRIAVRIDDAGIGLAPGARADALFEPFYTTKEHGMGMGLAICRSIVQAHHGAITAAQRAPHGCSVVFDLPARVEGGHEFE